MLFHLWSFSIPGVFIKNRLRLKSNCHRILRKDACNTQAVLQQQDGATWHAPPLTMSRVQAPDRAGCYTCRKRGPEDGGRGHAHDHGVPAKMSHGHGHGHGHQHYGHYYGWGHPITGANKG